MKDYGVDVVFRLKQKDGGFKTFASTVGENAALLDAAKLEQAFAGQAQLLHGDLDGKPVAIYACHVLDYSGKAIGVVEIAVDRSHFVTAMAGVRNISDAVREQNAAVRGSVLQPVVETVYQQPGKLAVGAAIGKGTLTVIRDLRLREPYTGRVQLVSGEIAEDLAHYFAVSEQVPSLVSLGVKMDQNGITCAGGLMVQLMPDAEEETIGYLEKRAAGFPEVSRLLEEGFSDRKSVV